MPSSILNSDDGVISGTAGLKNSGGDDAVLLIQTKGVTAQTVDAGQRTMFPTTIGLGGATPSTSGSGISFPATQSASTNANTLDDYEEGTFTLTIVMGTGTATLGTTVGTYTKIGRQVLVTFSVPIPTVGGTPTIERFEGLPFVSRSGADQAVGLIREGGLTGFGFQGITVQSQNWISMRRVSDNTVVLQAGMIFFGSIIYMV